MAITYQRGTTGSTTLGADINVDISGDAVGDCILVAVRCSGSSLPTAPAGWTTLASDGQSTVRQFIIATYVKQAGDTTFTFVVPGTASSSWLMDVFRGGTVFQTSTATNQAGAGNTIAWDPLTLASGSVSYLCGTWTATGGSIIQETGYTAASFVTQVQSLYKLAMPAGSNDPPDAVLSNSTQQNRIGWQIEIRAPSVTAPTVTITGGPTAPKVSSVTGKSSTQITWQSDQDFVNYQIRVVPSTSSLQTAGTLVEQDESPAAGGTAGTSYTSTIAESELVAASAAEGSNTLKVFAKNASGTWST